MTETSAEQDEEAGEKGEGEGEVSDILNMIMSQLSNDSSGARRFLEEMFRYLARQCNCVLNLRLVCKDFDEIIRTMRPGISCKPNIIRNVERGLRGTIQMELGLNHLGSEAVLLDCTETLAVVRILKTHYIIINLITQRQKLLFYPKTWQVCIGGRFVCFSRGKNVLLYDHEGNLLTRIELNCCWTENFPHNFYVQAMGRNFFIIRDNEQVLKFEVDVPGDGTFFVQLLHALGLERRPQSVARFQYRAKVSSDGRTYLLYNYCHIQRSEPIIIGEVLLWREKDQFSRSFLSLRDQSGKAMGVADVTVNGDYLLGIIVEGRGVCCWDIETGTIIKFIETTNCHLRYNITEQDCEIVQIIPRHESFSFMVDWQSLSISGVLSELRKSFKTVWTSRKCLKIVEENTKNEKLGMKSLCIDNYTFHQD